MENSCSKACFAQTCANECGNACSACTTNRCASEQEAFYATPDAATLNDCLGTCGDTGTGCRDAYVNAPPSEQLLYQRCFLPRLELRQGELRAVSGRARNSLRLDLSL